MGWKSKQNFKFMVDHSFLEAQVSENADLSFIRAVLNICLKCLSSSIWVGFFKKWKEVEIENCAIDFFVCYFFFIYFKPVSSVEGFILITFELWEAYCGGGTVTMKTDS